jgi:hypothetical protein
MILTVSKGETTQRARRNYPEQSVATALGQSVLPRDRAIAARMV